MILTCIVPVTKIEPYLVRISNLISEIAKYDEIALILVHDIQDNYSSPVLDQLLKDFPQERITYLVGTFGNPGDTRNFALERISTPWLFFADGDDLIYPDRYLKVLGETISLGCDLAVSGIRITSVKDEEVSRDHLINPRLSIQENLALLPAFTRIIYRSDFIQGVRFPSLAMAEDQCFLFSILERKPKIWVSEEIVYEYFIGSPSQLSSSSVPMLDLRESLLFFVRSFSKDNEKLFGASFIFLIRQIYTFTSRVKFRSLPFLIVLFPRFLWLILSHPIRFSFSLSKVFFFRKGLVYGKR